MYILKNVKIAANAIKDFNITVNKKSDHFTKLSEIKKLFDICYDNTKCILFEYDFSYELELYTNAINNIKNHTNKELNKLLKQTYLYLKHQIIEILRIAENESI